jgi:hypothetical protein
VLHAVIGQWNERFLGASQHLAIELYRNYAAADAKRIFDSNIIAGRAMAERNLEFWPARCPTTNAVESLKVQS